MGITECPLDRAVIDGAIALISSPGVWGQGHYDTGEQVCAHGAVLRQHCTPGDKLMWREIMDARGLTEQWNDRSGRTPDEVVAKFREVAEAGEDDMANVFGRNWRCIRALVRRLAAMNDDEIFQLDAAFSFHYEHRSPMSGSAPAHAIMDVTHSALDGQSIDALTAANDAALAAYMGREFATTATIDALCAPLRAVWPEFMTDAWLAEVTT